eukprot:scaffold23457_cov113-Cylindrotheca_fusiformis.AAC.1
MGSVDTGDNMESPSKKSGSSSVSSMSGDPSVSKRLDDLEAAMKSGDWSTVGASAALLAASQQDKGTPKTNAKSLLRGNMDAPSTNNMDEATATELEQMINNSDWEGVIQTAARLEAAKPITVSMDEDDDDDEDDGSSNSSAASKSGGGGGGSDFYVGQEQISPQEVDEEVRKEVVDLVAKVVPEELDNVDEMMGQFKGREHELLETLRTMQERDIALKAKRAAQQQTKLELSSEEKSEKLRRKMETIEAAAQRSQQGLPAVDNADDDDNDDDDSASL